MIYTLRGNIYIYIYIIGYIGNNDNIIDTLQCLLLHYSVC